MAAAKPFRSGHGKGQRAEGVGEGNGQADVAQVEHWGVNGHQDVVLEQGIGAGSVEWGIRRGEGPRTCRETATLRRLDTDLERVGHGEHQPEEEDRDPAHDRQCSGSKLVGCPAITTCYEPGEQREHQSPEDNRTLQGRPCGGYVERKRCGCGMVIGDVGEAEVVGEESQLHGCHRNNGADQEQSGRGCQLSRSGCACAVNPTPDQETGTGGPDHEAGRSEKSQHQSPGCAPPSSGTS